VRAAAHFCLLAGGNPYPADKWLLAALNRFDPRAATVARRPLDLDLAAEGRFNALWELWQLVDKRTGA